MYRKATKQFELFHVCLERMGRYLMANSVCANIENPERRDEARAELVATMAHAPMLPIDGLEDGRRDGKSQGSAERADLRVQGVAGNLIPFMLKPSGYDSEPPRPTSNTTLTSEMERRNPH